MAGWTFQVIPSAVDETPLPEESALEYVTRLAVEKARDVARLVEREDIVLGADTAVVLEDEILGKPGGPLEAAEMLRSLRDRTHLVMTGLAVLQPGSNRLITDVCTSRVQIRDFSEKEIQVYIETGDSIDKAGAYAIQNPEFDPVSQLDGCYANVVGLPICYMAHMLQDFGLYEPSGLTEPCRTNPGNTCRISKEIFL
jgi:nucleoside triphosphate pyrophosphatase